MAEPESPQAPPIPVPPAPQVPQALQAPQQPIPHMPPLNWSQFKPEFSGKVDKNAEACLLRINDWMDTHRFQENDKVQRFCLILTEAKVWYKSLRLINADWMALQNLFRQQYTKIGNTRKQLFHAWRSFHFDEKTETIDVTYSV